MAYIMFDDNQVVITGKIAMDFTFSHKICGECFYKAELQVKRLSDSVDTIPVLISEQIADITKSRVGEFAEIYGEFHSHNLREENHTRLELYVFAREVKFVEVMTLRRITQIEFFWKVQSVNLQFTEKPL